MGDNSTANTWTLSGSEMEKDISWKLVPSDWITDRAKSEDRRVSSWSSTMSFSPTVSTILMILERRKYVPSECYYQGWTLGSSASAVVRTLQINCFLNLLEKFDSISGGASIRLLTICTEVFPRAKLMFGPSKRFSSWDNSWSTWLELRLDTFLARLSSMLAWLSAENTDTGNRHHRTQAVV